MGIRINKVLGYGITDYTGDKDTRFNTRWASDIYNTDLRKTFLEFLDKKHKDTKDALSKMDISFTRKSVEDLSHWCPADWIRESPFAAETDNKKRPLVFCPHKDWERYDNAIDHYESKRRKDGGIKDYTQSLDKEYIYPYARYVDIRTGKIPGEKDYVFEVVRTYNSKFWKTTDDKWVKRIIGFSKEEFEIYVWPDIPKDIKLFAECFNIFTDKELGVYCLRPMIYTYWS